MRLSIAAFTALALAGGAGPALVGCARSGVPSAGLTMVGGRPTILFLSCNERSANVGVYVDTPLDARKVGPRPSRYTGYFDWNVVSSGPARLTEITLFAPAPPGWAQDENAISTLQPGVVYSLTGTGHANALPVRFTRADLPRLNADRVLIGDGPDKTKIVSRSQFDSGTC